MISVVQAHNASGPHYKICVTCIVIVRLNDAFSAACKVRPPGWVVTAESCRHSNRFQITSSAWQSHPVYLARGSQRQADSCRPSRRSVETGARIQEVYSCTVTTNCMLYSRANTKYTQWSQSTLKSLTLGCFHFSRSYWTRYDWHDNVVCLSVCLWRCALWLRTRTTKQLGANWYGLHALKLN